MNQQPLLQNTDPRLGLISLPDTGLNGLRCTKQLLEWTRIVEEELSSLNLAIVQKREVDALGHIQTLLAQGVDSEDPLWTWTPLHKAIEFGQWRVVQALCDSGGAKVRENLHLDLDLAQWTPLYHAAATGRAKAVSMLLRAGAEVDAVNSYGFTPLHHAAQGGHEEAIQALLSGGANVDAPDPFGCTALHHAAQGGQAGAIRALLGGGATVDAQDSDGRTPLHHAAQGGHEGAIRVLLTGRAKVNAQDSDGRTALHHADRGEHAGASIELRNRGANMTVFLPDFQAKYQQFSRPKGSQPIAIPQYQAMLDASSARDAPQSSAGTSLRRHEKTGPSL